MKKILIISVALLLSFSLKAQRNEVGLLLGTTYYLGDLNPSKQFFMTKPAGGIIYRYIINQRWAIKMDGLYGSVAGDDAKAGFNVQRNLSFKSPIVEFSSQLELNFLPYMTGNTEKNYFTPYIFAGISVFGFDPKAEYNGVWYRLKPLGTEGQGTSEYPDRKPYSLVDVAFPFGLGVKYSVGQSVCIGFEWGMRKTTTDYLDDVSKTYPDPVILSAENTPLAAALSNRSGETNVTDMQRGNPNTKDWYSFAGAFITVKFGTHGGGKCPAYGQKKYKDYNKSGNKKD